MSKDVKALRDLPLETPTDLSSKATKDIAAALTTLLADAFALAHGGQARIVQAAIQMQTIISLVSAGMGVALVPASLRNLARTGVSYMDLGGTAPVLETGITWRSGDTTPTIERFVSIAREASSLSSSAERQQAGRSPRVCNRG